MLDDYMVTSPGKFEAETEAAQYVYEHSLDGFQAEYSHDSFGWFVLYIAEESEPLAFPAYIMQEHDNGFVSLAAYRDLAEAEREWETLVNSMDSDE